MCLCVGLTPVCRRLSGGDFDGTVQTLLRAFQASLLQTYKSKFTQVRVHWLAVCVMDA